MSMDTQVILAPGVHGSRPAAGSTAVGALYFCTTHSLIYRNNGVTWDTVGIAAVPAPVIVYIDDTDSPYTMLGTEDVLVVDCSVAAVDVHLLPAASAPAKAIAIICKDGSSGPVTIIADTGFPDLIGSGTHAVASSFFSNEDDYAHIQPDGVSRWLGFKVTTAW